MANSIQPLVASMSFAPAGALVTEDAETSLVFVDVVDAAMVVPLAASQALPVASGVLPLSVVANAKSDIMLAVLPADALGPMRVTNTVFSEVKGPDQAQSLATNNVRSPTVSAFAPSVVPFQFYALMPPLPVPPQAEPAGESGAASPHAIAKAVDRAGFWGETPVISTDLPEHEAKGRTQIADPSTQAEYVFKQNVESPEVSDIAPSVVPFQFYVLMPPQPVQPPAKATRESDTASVQVIAKAVDHAALSRTTTITSTELPEDEAKAQTQIADASTEKAETVNILTTALNIVPFQADAQTLPPLIQSQVSAKTERSAPSAQALDAPFRRTQSDVLLTSTGTEPELRSKGQSGLLPTQATSDRILARDAVLRTMPGATLLDRLSDNAPLATAPPSIAESASVQTSFVPQKHASSALLHDQGSLPSAALAPYNRSFLAPLFASVPQLAPKIFIAPDASDSAKAEALSFVVDDAPAAVNPSAPVTPKAAPQALPSVEGSKVSQNTETDEFRAFNPEGGFILPTEGKAALQAPSGMQIADKALQQTNTPIPIAALPQTIARIIAKDGPQPVSLQLDPIELGTVAFNMETGPAGLVVTITAERPETLDLLRRHADLFLADLRQSGFNGASLQFSQGQTGQGQAGQGQSGQGQFGHGQFAEGQNGQAQTNGRAGSEYAGNPAQIETPLHIARQNHAGGLNLRL